jgi:ABC-type sugar transport system permease subunit
MEFLGLRNFQELLSSAHFWQVVMKNTFALIFVGGFFVFLIALMFAHLLTEMRFGKRFFRAVIFFPNVINPVALSILWAFIYNRNWGLLNQLLKSVGLGALQQTWTASGTLFWALLVALIWMWVGFYTVILIAALDRVPGELVDAARIEGASPYQIFFRIKIPLIRDVMGIAIVLWVINAMKEFSFLYVWGGVGGFPHEGQQNLAVYMYATAFGARASIYRMGYASAMGVILLALVALLVLLFWRAMGRQRIEY